MPKVSIIIVSYNVKYYIEQCLNSVLRSVSDAQIIVVDNNSTDGSVEYLREHFPQIEIIANDSNAGFGHANNMALARVTGRYVLFLNPDTVVAEKTIPGCVEYMDIHPEVGAVGVCMLYGFGRFALESRRSLPTPLVSFWHMTGLGQLFPNSRVFAKYHLTYMDAAKECPIEVVSGAYMFVRKEALDKTGGFDESFFMYGEDIDLSYRILQLGYKNRYLPLPIVHYKGESTSKTSYSYAKVFYDAMIIFFDKHFSRYSALFALVVKIVIGIKKIFTFVGQNIVAHGRNMLEIKEMCLYVGRPETFDKVNKIIALSNVLCNPQFIEGRENVSISLENSVPENIKAIIFDTSAFSYNEIMDWIHDRALEGKEYTMGLYSSETGKLITQMETL